MALEPGTIRITDTVGAFTKEVTIPSGVTTMYVNGRQNGVISIQKLKTIESEEFWEGYNELYNAPKYKAKVGVRKTSTGVYVYLSGYTETEDLKYSIVKKNRKQSS